MIVYGPVPSRRLGRSLGVDPIPFKTCNYSRVYCQLGGTTHMTNQRKDFFPSEELLNETKMVIEVESSHSGIDFVSFVGEGEPTLCKSWLNMKTKEIADIPIAVDTNGTDTSVQFLDAAASTEGHSGNAKGPGDYKSRIARGYAWRPVRADKNEIGRIEEVKSERRK